MSSSSDKSNPSPAGDDQWLELLSAYADGEVSPAERAEVEERLRDDADARRLLEQFQSLSDTLHSVPAEQAPSGLRQAVLSAARQQTPGAGGPLADAATRFPLGRSRRGWVWAATAIAAALLVMVSQQPTEDRQMAGADRGMAATDESASVESMAEPQPTGDVTPSAVPELRAAADPFMGRGAPDGDSDAAPAEPARRAGRQGGSPPMPAAPPVTELLASGALNEAVVVNVGLRREAFENRFLDGVLGSNGIVVRPTPAVLASNLRQNARRLEEIEQLTERSDARTEASEEALQRKSLAELVLVDAPMPPVIDTVSVLNRDYDNCVSLRVEPAFNAPQPRAYNKMQENVIGNTAAVDSLSIYSRSGRARQSRAAPNQAAQVAEQNLQQRPAQQGKIALKNRSLGNAFRYEPQGELAQEKDVLYSQLNYFANATLLFARGAEQQQSESATVADLNSNGAVQTQPERGLAADFLQPTKPLRIPVVFYVQPEE